jgi:hypothetical protein
MSLIPLEAVQRFRDAPPGSARIEWIWAFEF